MKVISDVNSISKLVLIKNANTRHSTIHTLDELYSCTLPLTYPSYTPVLVLDSIPL